MKKEQKEQAQIILKDINGAIKSWLNPIKEEQKKLLILIYILGYCVLWKN